MLTSAISASTRSAPRWFHAAIREVSSCDTALPCSSTWRTGSAEDPLDRALDQLAGVGEEEKDRQQRQRDVGGDQLGLELGAERAVLALDPQLEQVAQQDEEDGEDEDDVDVAEDEEEEAVGQEARRRLLAAQDDVVDEREEQERAAPEPRR